MAANTGFKVQCPSCETFVTIKNASVIGKKIDCPKCKYRFVVEAPGDEDEAAEGGMKKGSAGGATAVARKAPGKSKSRSDDGDEAPKKKSNTVLFVGIGIAVLAVGILVAAYLGGLFGDEEPSKPSTPSSVSKGNTSGTSNSGGGEGGVKGGANSEGAGPAGDPGAGTPVAVATGPGSPRDATNLLPNDAQWAVDVQVQEILSRPMGSRLFHQDKQTGPLVKSNLGFPVEQIERVVAAGGGEGSWSFTVIKTKSAYSSDAAKAALELGEPLDNIKNRDYYLSKNNEVFFAVGNFFANKLKDIGFKLDPPPGAREVTVCLLDSKTMVVADRQAMVKFLEADAQPDYRSRLMTAPAGGGPGGGMPGGPGSPGPGGPPGGYPGGYGGSSPGPKGM